MNDDEFQTKYIHQLGKIITESPDQPLTQPPAPSKELDDIILTISERYFPEPFSRSQMREFGRALAADLGKEREAERANSTTAIHVAEMDARLLRDENTALKRELAEAKQCLAESNSTLTKRTKELLVLSAVVEKMRKALEAFGIQPTRLAVEMRNEALALQPDMSLYGRLLETLEFYADPGTYHGMAVRFYPPTGGFDTDWSEDHGDPTYSYAKPGKRARQLLADLGQSK